jgi:hypothetical protein
MSDAVSDLIGLCFDLALSGLFWWQHEQQVCRNHRSAEFFTAEQAKVEGQVAGLQKIRTANGDPKQTIAGFDDFIKASQAYLDSIKNRETC